MLIVGGQPTNFNYCAFDGQTGLHVGGNVFDITTGTPTVVGSLIPMTDEGNGVYVGSFTPALGKFYTVVAAVYTDNTYSTVNTGRPPGASQFDSFTVDNTTFTFNYGTWDFNDVESITATVFNLTDSTQSSFAMTHVAFGVYFGKYVGTVGKEYFVSKIPADSTYAPAGDSFQCFQVFSGPPIVLPAATLVGQSLIATLSGQSLGGILVGR